MQDVTLDKVFVEGQTIQIKLNEKQGWLNATLFKSYDSILEIDLLNEEINFDDCVAIGDSVNCICSQGDFRYDIQGWISRVKSDFPQRLTIQIHKVNNTNTKEDNSQYNIYFGCIIKGETKEKGIFAIAKRISRETITFINKSKMEWQEKMHIELLLPENVVFRTPVRIKEIVKFEDSKEVIAYYEDTDILNRRILDNFITEMRSTEPDKFNNEDSYWKKNSKIKG